MSDGLGIPTTCEHCGGPLKQDVALVNTGKGCVRLPLPPYCPSAACRAARDEEAIADLVARGIIDP